jgi:PEP-CTERM/exosortase A-associated glycosyltransferase
MRVLHVLHNSLPLVCGYSIRSGHIVRLQKRDGYDLLAVTSAQHPNGEAMREVIDGVEHRRTPSYQGKQWPLWREWQLVRRLAREVDRAVREWRPDLVHAHSPVLVGLPALQVARRHGLPFVYEVRDLWENALVDRGRFGHRSPQYQLARRGETYVLSKADAVVTICETLKAELEGRLRGRGKVHVVANGVDTDAFHPRASSEEVRRKHGLAGKRVILYVGTFQPYEGLELLVRSLQHVLARLPDAHLVVVGGSASLAYRGATTRGTQEEVLDRVVSDLHLGEHVTMTGRVPHEEVGDLYSIADCVVYPRILTRTTSLTTPLKPLEAMAMGKAVAVSDLPPMKELVRDGETGLTFAAGDESALARVCIKLLEDLEFRQGLGRAAREFVVAERQWPDLVRRYRWTYEESVRRLRPPGATDSGL